MDCKFYCMIISLFSVLFLVPIYNHNCSYTYSSQSLSIHKLYTLKFITEWHLHLHCLFQQAYMLLFLHIFIGHDMLTLTENLILKGIISISILQMAVIKKERKKRYSLIKRVFKAKSNVKVKSDCKRCMIIYMIYLQ